MFGHFYGRVGVSGGEWRYILGRCGWIDTFYGWVEWMEVYWVDGGILWMGGSEWGSVFVATCFNYLYCKKKKVELLNFPLKIQDNATENYLLPSFECLNKTQNS